MSSASTGEKTKEERVKEGIQLLRQLKDTGVDVSYIAFKEVQERISDWVNTGDAWTGKIKFPDYGRVAEILLPRRVGAVASIAFRVV